MLDGIDPNPQNIVGAGIVVTSSQQVGVLLRLEPNTQSKMYRVTIRSTRDIVSSHLVKLIEQII
ncbi:unnamed protein product [Trichobilharzia regenti]|nr:unnamed protein product [Trichobilharzia regenti]